MLQSVSNQKSVSQASTQCRKNLELWTAWCVLSEPTNLNSAPPNVYLALVARRRQRKLQLQLTTASKRLVRKTSPLIHLFLYLLNWVSYILFEKKMRPIHLYFLQAFSRNSVSSRSSLKHTKGFRCLLSNQNISRALMHSPKMTVAQECVILLKNYGDENFARDSQF